MATTTPPPSEGLPDGNSTGDALYEMVEGHVVALPPMGAYPTWVASLLVLSLGSFASAHRLGRVVAEMLFRLDSAKDLQRRPDVAFVSYERWPRERQVPDDAAWNVVPDLAIEVVSPTNTASEIATKVRDYLQAGVRRVWVVYPNERLVYVFESPGSIRIFPPGDELDGDPILPGFRLRLTTLFEVNAD